MAYEPEKYHLFTPLKGRTGACMLLILLILAAYGQVLNFEFIDYDDNVYVTENRQVQAGLTLEGIGRAFSFTEQYFNSYWQPLTWLSHMLDVELFGMRPGYHHLTGVILHIANSLLLLLLLNSMTGRWGPSAMVAALFALHPLNVESVAWVSSRKNVLSTFFWMLSMWGYVRYSRNPAMSRYQATLLAMILGLMCKPMLVTLPFAFLLLDFWPLGRWRPDRRRRPSAGAFPFGAANFKVRFSTPAWLILEKIPFLLISLISVLLSSTMARNYRTIVPTEMVSIKLRVANALVSYIKYIGKLLWPQNLAILYPFPQQVPAWQAWGAVVALTGASWVVWRGRRERPYLLFGWFWYLGTLMPVIGLLQAGIWPEMADRWMYIPSVGLFIMFAWGMSDLLKAREYSKTVPAAVAATLILTLATATRAQVGYWRNSTVLFKHTLKITKNNLPIYNNLGVALGKQGRLEEAVRYYEQALRIDSSDAVTHDNYANALAALGRHAEAIRHYEAALRFAPRYARAHYNLGSALMNQGRLDAARDHYIEALKIDPRFAEAYNNLGSTFMLQGRVEEASAYFRKALQIRPDYTEAQRNLQASLLIRQEQDKHMSALKRQLAGNPRDFTLHYKLGKLFQKQGDLDKALAHYRQAAALAPESIETWNELGMIYALKGDYQQARSCFKVSVGRKPEAAETYYFIAGTYARQGRTSEAVHWLRQAVARGYNNWDLIKTDRNLENIRGSAYYRRLMVNR